MINGIGYTRAMLVFYFINFKLEIKKGGRMITTKYGNFESQQEHIAHLESLLAQEQERADHAYDESQKAHDRHQDILEKFAKLRAFFEEVDNENN